MLCLVLLVSLFSVAFAVDCTTSYTLGQGDVSGSGSIDGLGGASTLGTTTEACGLMCDMKDSCISYEFQESDGRCHLNDAAPDSNTTPSGWILCTRDSKNTFRNPDSCTASSEYSGSYDCGNSIQGVAGDWASLGEGVGSWIQYNWNSATTLRSMIFTNRDDDCDSNRAATVSFSNGNSISATFKRYGATPINFGGDRTITWLRITMTEVYCTDNNGAGEVQFHTVDQDVTSEYTCANQNGRCECRGRAKYGIGATWTDWIYLADQTHYGRVTCDADSFGSNPAVGVTKTCVCDPTGYTNPAWMSTTSRSSSDFDVAGSNGCTVSNAGVISCPYNKVLRSFETLARPAVTTAQIRATGGSECISMTMFPGASSNGKNSNLGLEIGGWPGTYGGKYRMDPGNSQGSIGAVDGAWRDIKIVADSANTAQFWLDGAVVYSTSSTLTSGYLRFIPGCTDMEIQNIRTTSWVCPSGYTQKEGDVSGYGSINGKGGQSVTGLTNAQCADLCDSERTCRTYEFATSTGQCNLNDQVLNEATSTPSGYHICKKDDMCAGWTCQAADQCRNAGTCNAATGVCTNPNKADRTACDDADEWTSWDQCMSGVCVGDYMGLKCAESTETCTCIGKAKYGVSSSWTTVRTVDRSVTCNTANFGGTDPAPNSHKECHCLHTDPSAFHEDDCHNPIDNKGWKTAGIIFLILLIFLLFCVLYLCAQSNSGNKKSQRKKRKEEADTEEGRTTGGSTRGKAVEMSDSNARKYRSVQAGTRLRVVDDFLTQSDPPERLMKGMMCKVVSKDDAAELWLIDSDKLSYQQWVQKKDWTKFEPVQGME